MRAAVKEKIPRAPLLPDQRCAAFPISSCGRPVKTSSPSLVWVDTFVQWIRPRRSGLITWVSPMRTSAIRQPDSFSDSIYEEQGHLAERELSSFIAAVNASYGPEQARLSTEDWLEESELMDSPPRSETRNWRAVTIAASARLANRFKSGAAMIDAKHIDTDTKVSPIP